MIIHFNGYPGTGKLTIAQILAKRLGAHLVDNHAVINTVYAAGHQHASPGYLDFYMALFTSVCQELRGNKAISHILMTNALANEIPRDIDKFMQIKELAAQRQEPFIPVLLHCSREENIRRVVAPSRAEKKKLTNSDILKTIMDEKYTIYHPDDHPYNLRLDTTHLSPDQASDEIFNHIQKLGLNHVPLPSHPASH